MISIHFVICITYSNQLECNYLRNKTFSEFFTAFLRSTSNFQHFEKKMSLIAHGFPKLRIAKDVVRWISKKPSFRTTFDSQHAKGDQKGFYQISSSVWGKLRCKRSLLAMFQVVGLFVNTLTANGKYSFLNRGIYRNQFKCNYLRNKKLFLNFFLQLWTLALREKCPNADWTLFKQCGPIFFKKGWPS